MCQHYGNGNEHNSHAAARGVLTSQYFPDRTGHQHNGTGLLEWEHPIPLQIDSDAYSYHSRTPFRSFVSHPTVPPSPRGHSAIADDSVDVTSEPLEQDISVAASHITPNKRPQLEVQLGGAVTLQCPQGKSTHLPPRHAPTHTQKMRHPL